MYKLSYKSPILFYDGVCNLCNGFVQMVIRHDKSAKIKFCALQDESGLAMRNHLNQNHDISTAIGLFSGKIYTHSDVLLMIAKVLGGRWKLVIPLYIVPKFIRDKVYNWVAKNRYKWFGQKNSCPVPDAQIRDRFLTQIIPQES